MTVFGIHEIAQLFAALGKASFAHSLRGLLTSRLAVDRFVLAAGTANGEVLFQDIDGHFADDPSSIDFLRLLDPGHTGSVIAITKRASVTRLADDTLPGDNLGFHIRLPHGCSALLILGRGPGKGFSDEELLTAAAFEPIVTEALGSHVERLRAASSEAEEERGEFQNLEENFAQLFEATLTPTQRAIVRLILRGHSSLSIATHLNVSEGTIKVHRANIYKRLSISSQAELFRMFIDHVLRP